MKRICGWLLLGILAFGCTNSNDTNSVAATPAKTAPVTVSTPDIYIEHKPRNFKDLGGNGNFSYNWAVTVAQKMADEITRKVGYTVEVERSGNDKNKQVKPKIGTFNVFDEGKPSEGEGVTVIWHGNDGTTKETWFHYCYDDALPIELWDKVLGDVFPPDNLYEVVYNFQLKRGMVCIFKMPVSEIGNLYWHFKNESGLSLIVPHEEHNIKDAKDLEIISRSPQWNATGRYNGNGPQFEITFSHDKQIK